MNFLFALMVLMAHLATLVRVLVYERNGARYRRPASWVAWALVVVISGSSIELTLNARQTGFFEAATAVLLAVFVYGVRGNVARLLRSE